MRIKIIGKERLIAFNGQDGVACPKGSTHDVSDDLGAALVRDKWAQDVTPVVVAPSVPDDIAGQVGTRPDDAEPGAPIVTGPSETKVVEPGEAK